MSPAIAMSSVASQIMPTVSMAVRQSTPLDVFVEMSLPAFNLPAVAISVPSHDALPGSWFLDVDSVSSLTF